MDGGTWWAAAHGVAKSQTRLSDFTLTFHFHALEKERATHSSVLAWRIPGTGSLVGCRLWGHTESDTTERLHFHFNFSDTLCACVLSCVVSDISLLIITICSSNAVSRKFSSLAIFYFRDLYHYIRDSLSLCSLF